MVCSLENLPELQDEFLYNRIEMLESILKSNQREMDAIKAELEANAALMFELGDPWAPNPWGPNDDRWASRNYLQKGKTQLSRRSMILTQSDIRTRERCNQATRLLNMTIIERVAEERAARLAKALPIIAIQTAERYGELTHSNLRQCWGMLSMTCNYGDLLRPLGREIPDELLSELVGRSHSDFI